MVSQWAAALRQLRSACFIAADVHVKQGLGKLPSLTDLEFGSNNSELEIESAACLPPSVTHLSLEHCCLTAVPSCITRLAQVGSAACLPAHLPARLPACAPACLPARLPPRQMCRMPVSLRITLLQLPAGAGAGYISSQPLTTVLVPHAFMFFLSLSPPPFPGLQLRSLDLSQNTFEEEGEETATLADLTSLECLKLAHCRLGQVSALRLSGVLCVLHA